MTIISEGGGKSDRDWPLGFGVGRWGWVGPSGRRHKTRIKKNIFGDTHRICQCPTCTATAVSSTFTTTTTTNGLALCHDVTLDIVTHRWVPVDTHSTPVPERGGCGWPSTNTPHGVRRSTGTQHHHDVYMVAEQGSKCSQDPAYCKQSPVSADSPEQSDQSEQCRDSKPHDCRYDRERGDQEESAGEPQDHRRDQES